MQRKGEESRNTRNSCLIHDQQRAEPNGLSNRIAVKESFFLFLSSLFAAQNS
jgi:hypothetical protein